MITTTTTVSFFRQSKSSSAILLRAAAGNQEDDDEEDDDDWEDESPNEADPLARGADAVAWLPSVYNGIEDANNHDDDNSEILPLFPLGGIVYIPNSEHILNIFEPRYRQMYNDILMKGTKKFVVSMSHPTKSGVFAQVGVLFELQDLKEVSEQTNDQIKFICNHSIKNRVLIHQILNPQVWETRETYLKVKATVLKEEEKDTTATSSATTTTTNTDVYGAIAAASTPPPEELALKTTFGILVNLQHELEEDVRFTRASVATLKTSPGGLWESIRLWQSFADQRLMARQNELQSDFQEKLQAYLKKEKKMEEDELPSSINFSDLSRELQQEVQELQKRMAIELRPLMNESTLTMQKLLEGKDHGERLRLLKEFMTCEIQRLKTKKSLRGMLSSAGASSNSVEEDGIPPEERLSGTSSGSSSSSNLKDDDSSSTTSTSRSTIFTDEEDAFQ